MKSAIAVLGAGVLVALVAAQSLGLFGGGSPTITSPAPLPLLLPVMLGLSGPVTALAFAAWFFLWIPSLYRGGSVVPVRAIGLGVAVALLSGAWYAIAWRDGIQFQGFAHTWVCLALSILLAIGSLFALARARKAPSFRAALAAHALVFVWLVSYAFPFLGEGP